MVGEGVSRFGTNAWGTLALVAKSATRMGHPTIDGCAWDRSVSLVPRSRKGGETWGTRP